MKFKRAIIIEKLEAQLKLTDDAIAKVVPDPEPDWEELRKNFVQAVKAWAKDVEERFDPQDLHTLLNPPHFYKPTRYHTDKAEPLKRDKREIEAFMGMLKLAADDTISLNTRDYNLQRIFQIIKL